jgi:gamma-glutamyltranspeptidase/glutathione hydrolase
MTGSDKIAAAGRPMAAGRHGVAATPHVLASAAAIEALKAGGNAVDAAVTAAAVAAVVQPFTSGLGGGGWATVHIAATGTTEVLEFHGRIPAATDAARFVADRDGLVDGPRLEADGRGLLGSLVPGVVAGWAALLQRHGSLPLAAAIAPAIRHAADGFAVSPLLHATIAANRDRLRRWPSSARTFLRDDRAPAAGATLVQPELAATLSRIACNGADELRTGATARALADFYHANGGALGRDDLADYVPTWHAPLSATFRGYTIQAAPAPCGDLSFVQGMKLLETYAPFVDFLDPDYVHVSIESAKLVQRDRARWVGDRASPATLARLLEPTYIAELHARIGVRARTGEPDPPSPDHTITLAVADDEGNAVHLMQTVGVPFGTGAVAGDTGIVTNSSLYFAHVDPTRPNGIVPGRRLEQNPCVIMLFDDARRLRLAVGSPGGKTRVETVRQMVANVVDFGMTIQQAVDAPRFLSAPDGRAVELEPGIAARRPDLAAALAARGHVTRPPARRLGSGQGIAIDGATGLRSGGADWRQEAAALAY